ncbi:type I restriction enzyme HsdR N-terminal domain-containing protein [Chloroflexota bacterium]
MPKSRLNKETKKAILDARKMIENIARADGNEAETRRRLERIFESVMGYDALKHISREHAIHGVGDTEYCDFAVQVDCDEEAVPNMLVEIKRVGIDLTAKHLKQAASYAINIGCEWVLLTNSKEWKLYHITFGQPPQPKMIESWDLITDELSALAKKFEIISYKSVRKQGLGRLWEKRNVTTPSNMLKAILSEESIKSYQRRIKKSTDVAVSPEDIVAAIRHLLNEAALNEMEKIKISLPEKKARSKKAKPKAIEEPAAEISATVSQS